MIWALAAAQTLAHELTLTHACHRNNVSCCVTERCSVSANKPAAKPPTAPQKSWVSLHTQALTRCFSPRGKIKLDSWMKFTAGEREKKKIVWIRAGKCCYINLMWARSILQHLWLRPTPLSSFSEMWSRKRLETFKPDALHNATRRVWFYNITMTLFL